MSTKDERKDLVENPLPAMGFQLSDPEDYVTNCPETRVLISVLTIDEEINRINDLVQPYINHLQAQKNALMERAKREGITEDLGAVIVEVKGKLYRNEIEDLDKFRQTFKEDYEVIREIQEKEIEEKYKKQMRELEESKIPLTLADKHVGKDKVTAFVGYKPQTITYEIQRKA